MVIRLSRGVAPLQPMLTFSLVEGTENIIDRTRALARQAAQSGFDILRCKIEQEASINAPIDYCGPHRYFEWHGRLVVVEALRPTLAALCQQFGGHLSNNALRGGDIRYVTLREPEAVALLASRVAALDTALRQRGWVIDKQHFERVVHDSNLSLDEGWLTLPP